MLVLTRKTNEQILIGGVELTVLTVRGEQVKLGINAPREVVIRRGELCDRSAGKKRNDRKDSNQQ